MERNAPGLKDTGANRIWAKRIEKNNEIFKTVTSVQRRALLNDSEQEVFLGRTYAKRSKWRGWNANVIYLVYYLQKHNKSVKE